MSTTSFMNLVLPSVLSTLGPEWASELNAALEVVDAHDHSSEKGIKIKPNGIDINANLTFSNFSAVDLKAAVFTSNLATLTGASFANSVYSTGGNLYFTNGSGVAIQITSGGSIVSTPSAVQNFGIITVNSDLAIAPADTFVVVILDTTASRTVTLPLAGAVATGRTYVIKDATGNMDVNPTTLATQGSDTVDGSSSISLDSNRSATWVISDGVSKWYIF